MTIVLASGVLLGVAVGAAGMSFMRAHTASPSIQRAHNCLDAPLSFEEGPFEGDAQHDLRRTRIARALYQLLLARKLTTFEDSLDSNIHLLLIAVCDTTVERSDVLKKMLQAPLDEVFPPAKLKEAQLAECGVLVRADGTQFFRWKPQP